MLDKPIVELSDLLNLGDTDRFVSLIQEFAFRDPSDLSTQFILDYKDSEACLTIVRILGALTQNVIKINDLMLAVADISCEDELEAYIDEQSLALKASLRKENVSRFIIERMATKDIRNI